MSEETETAATACPVTEATHNPVPATPALTHLGGRNGADLLLGFHFLFWGMLILLAALAESLVSIALRPFWAFFVGAGSLAVAHGAWRLHRVNDLGIDWHRRTRELLIGAALTAYLSLYYLMWRQRPLTLYFLGHALAFGAALIILLCLLCLPVAVLARAAGRRSLAIQCIAFGSVAIILLFPVFGLIAQTMLAAQRRGSDPLGVVQFWLQHSPLRLLLLGLLPFSLTLSLLWSAKDLVWELLNASEPPPPPPTP